MCVLLILGGCIAEESHESAPTAGSTESLVTEQITTTTIETTTSTKAKTTTTTTTTTKVTTTTKPTTTIKTTTKATTVLNEKPVQSAYVLNISTLKFHRGNCRHIKTMDAENRQNFTGSREQIIGMGYSPCGTCKP